VIIARHPHRLEWTLGACAVVAGLVSWVVYASADLVLSHHDARAHLVVARRIIDNITPGWRQFGAVWLPLPHLLTALPTQIDLFYRTGAFASALSIGCCGITAWSAARLTRSLTGSTVGATTAAVLLIANPSLLYVSITPLTEPLFIALTFLSIVRLYDWADHLPRAPRSLPWLLFASAWTRYEAWLVIGTGIALASLARWRRGADARQVAADAGRLAAWPLAAIVLFMLNSRATVGSWLVTDGFFVPDPEYLGKPGRVAGAVWWSLRELGGHTVRAAFAAAVPLIVLYARRTRRLPSLVPFALLTLALLPAYAFYGGHPLRLRFMLPSLASCAVFTGIGVGLLHRVSTKRTEAAAPIDVPRDARMNVLVAISAAGLIAAAVIERPPFDAQAPILLEALDDSSFREGRRAVTACLRRDYAGEKVVASMGALAPYMQELSAAGLNIADFIHEGNGSIWSHAISSQPSAHAGWMLLGREEHDALTRRVRAHPGLLEGMTEMCQGGGVRLYRADSITTSARSIGPG
jgi:hypothetical protein